MPRLGDGAVALVAARALLGLLSVLSEASAGRGGDGAGRLAAVWREAQPEKKQTQNAPRIKRARRQR
jgi:hypothetical protein